MWRIFVSHSGANNVEAVALRDWLKSEGWEDVFLDVDPDHGIAAGELWERALNEAASRCEAVWCRANGLPRAGASRNSILPTSLISGCSAFGR
jgi:hypothetical protein